MNKFDTLLVRVFCWSDDSESLLQLILLMFRAFQHKKLRGMMSSSYIEIHSNGVNVFGIVTCYRGTITFNKRNKCNGSKWEKLFLGARHNRQYKKR